MECKKIAEALNRSDYFIAATGIRNVDFDELIDIIKIIRTDNINFLSSFKKHKSS